MIMLSSYKTYPESVVDFSKSHVWRVQISLQAQILKIAINEANIG